MYYLFNSGERTKVALVYYLFNSGERTKVALVYYLFNSEELKSTQHFFQNSNVEPKNNLAA